MSYSFADYQGHLDEMLRDAYNQGRKDVIEKVNQSIQMDLNFERERLQNLKAYMDSLSTESWEYECADGRKMEINRTIEMFEMMGVIMNE